MDRWDPSQLTLPTGTAASPPKPRKGRRIVGVAGRFIKGPIDVAWLMQARKLGVTAYHVGLSLWFLSGLKHSDIFLVSNLIMQEWGVSSDAKSRALRTLEKAGLIAVERRGKRSPRVTLLVRQTREIEVSK
jgi:DNA-binding transcriptional ArsR family regulator